MRTLTQRLLPVVIFGLPVITILVALAAFAAVEVGVLVAVWGPEALNVSHPAARAALAILGVVSPALIYGSLRLVMPAAKPGLLRLARWAYREDAPTPAEGRSGSAGALDRPGPPTAGIEGR